MRSALFGLVAALVLPVATPRAQVVHVVSDDTELQLALTAAADGDTILVQAVTAGDVTIVGKSLALVGDLTPRPRLGKLVVQGLAADQVVAVRGIRFDSSAPDPAIALIDNAGQFWLEDSRGNGGDGDTGTCNVGGAGLYAHDSDAVTVVRSTLAAGNGSSTATMAPGCIFARDGASGVFSEGSQVTLFDCVVRAGNGGSDVALVQGARGGRGVEARLGSTVVMTSSPAKGGNGGDGCTPITSPACRGGAGLYIDDTSTARVQDGDPGGGAGGELTNGNNAADGLAFDGDGNGVLDLWDAPTRVLEMDSPVRFGDVATIHYDGEPGDLMGLFVSLLPGYLPLVGKQGVFALSDGFLGPLFVITVVDVDGVLDVPFAVPDPITFGLESVPLFGQAFAQDVLGNVRLSGPTGMRILASFL